MASSRRMPRLAIACAVALTTIVTARVTGAQELRGTVMSSDRVTPASGVVLVMLHATRDDSIVARTVSTERGRFSLKPPAGVTTRLRMLRIGFLPTEVGRVSLRVGETRDTTLVLHDLRVQLATVNVKDNARCEVRPNGALQVAKLFDAVRTALIATTVPIYGRSTQSDYVNFSRIHDRRGKLFAPVSRTDGSGATLQTFAAIGADSLAIKGYMVPEGDVATYYAPDAEVLLSEKFLSQHCLVLAEGKGPTQQYLGIGFRPVQKRGNLVDVRGTFWVDRESLELQFLEFEYENLPSLIRSVGLGGRVDYERMAHGEWFISSWSIRMPMIETGQVQMSTGPLGVVNSTVRQAVVGQQVTGAAVAAIKVDDDVLFLNANASRVGEMPEDESAARVAVGEPVPVSINYADAASVAALDSAGVAFLCGVPQAAMLRGLLLGRVHDGKNVPVPNVSVAASWKYDFRLSNSGISYNTYRAQASSNTLGAYQLCGIPVDRSVTVSAMNGNRRLRSAIVRLSENRPAAVLNLAVPAQSGQKQ